jgi:nitroimidazol reductase NimA-like FMN-containing flavoprotein (pyridoxamine 5'-phosphate oxidase superfamily)
LPSGQQPDNDNACLTGRLQPSCACRYAAAMPKLTTAELHSFLDEPGHLLRLATAEETGLPLVVPIWFIAEEGRIWFTPRERSEWWTHLQRDARACGVIDEEAAPWRKVMLRGSVRLDHLPGDDDAWRDRYRRIACRYTPERSADAYIERTINERRALLSMTIVDDNTTTWRMPVAGEDARGVWAERYYQATPR